MRRGTFGVVLLMALFFLSLTGMKTVREQLTPISMHMELAARAAEESDFEKAAALTEKARAEWEDHRIVMSSLAKQEMILEIDGLWDQAAVYCRSRESAHCSEACMALKNHLQALAEDQLPSMYNLL